MGKMVGDGCRVEEHGSLVGGGGEDSLWISSPSSKGAVMFCGFTEDEAE